MSSPEEVARGFVDYYYGNLGTNNIAALSGLYVSEKYCLVVLYKLSYQFL